MIVKWCYTYVSAESGNLLVYGANDRNSAVASLFRCLRGHERYRTNGRLLRIELTDDFSQVVSTTFEAP